ncbi:MAG: hypothetical protein ACRD0P_03690 [Stackebrandtia sp.]
MNRRSVREPPPRRLDERAVAARIKRIRIRRTTVGKAGWAVLPLFGLALAVGAAALVLPVGYVFFGTDIPFVVNEAGTKAPPTTAGRLRAGAIAVLCWAAFIGLMWVPVRNTLAFRGPQRFASRRIGFDAAGVWLARGRRVVEGLRWTDVQAVSIVEEWQSTTVPPATASRPFVEVFPVEAAKEKASLLGSLIVNAPPPQRGVRGKRHVIPLDCGAEEIRRLTHALDGFAPGKRVSGGIARNR